MRGARRRRLPALAGALAGAAGLLALALDPGGVADGLRERAFDAAIALRPLDLSQSRVTIVDIDRASLASVAPWPWPRERLAALLSRIAAAGPAVVAIDIVLAERPGAKQGDAALASALAAAPSVLGAVLDPDGLDGADAQEARYALRGPIVLTPALSAPGLVAPVPALREAARGLGIVSLTADRTAQVRAVPLIAAAGGRPFAGFAAEALRVAAGEVTPILDGGEGALAIGPHHIPFAADASMRLVFSASGAQAARTVSAADVLAGAVPDSRLAGRLVLVGSGAPEAGGLRRTASGPFTPSIRIHADALAQMEAGRRLTRPTWAGGAELAGAAGLAAAATALAAGLAPMLASALALILAMTWAGSAVAAATQGGLLIDPAGPVLVAALAFQAAALTGFALVRRERAAIVRRFEQHLPAEVVARIADDPSRLRLDGEERVVTALFTDIEGFTALTERIGPRELVALLDGYLERVCGLVVAHGGMVDKVVGDAVHAFFNAPVDLPDHADRAVDCALAILAETERYRAQAAPRAAGFGRTRIGVESGAAVVGDVGGGRKLDYTAHGRAINLAARLEASNKRFGSSIAVGPGAVALCSRRRFRPLGEIEPFAGAHPVPVSEPLS